MKWRCSLWIWRNGGVRKTKGAYRGVIMLAVTVDKIMYDALLAALPVLCGLVHEKGLHPEQKGYLCEGYAAYQQVKEALEKAEGRERP